MQRDADPPKATPSELARSLADPAFLAALCHDLRGPLGAIGTWIHVLGSGRADAATQQQALAAMQRDVVAQTRLVEQLTDLSSMLAGTLLLSIENVDLVPLLAELGVELQASRSSLPAVVADPKRLRQLLAILLLAGGPAMVTAECEEPFTLSIRGVIREGGPGFVGLTLARGLADVQGGHLTISPAPEGTVFALQLPAAKG